MRKTAWLLAAPLVLAAADAPRFAPPDGHALRCTTVETRRVGDASYHFSTMRTVAFARDGRGWRATLVQDKADTDAPPGMAGQFLAALAPLASRPVVFHLDAAGAVTAIDDEDALWAAVTQGVAGPGAAIMRSLPPARRRSLLASTLETMIAPTDAARPAAAGLRVTLPGRRVGAVVVDLAGTQTVTRTDDGLTRLVTHAVADPDTTTHLDWHVDRLVDPATGLLRRQETMATTRLDTAVTQATTVVTVTLVP